MVAVKENKVYTLQGEQEKARCFTRILSAYLDAFNNYIKPALDDFATSFNNMWAEYIEPAIDTGIEYFGKLADTVSLLWTEHFEPFVTWMIDTFAPLFGLAVSGVGILANTAFALIGVAVKTIFEALSGLLDFVVDVFSGDWDAAWTDIQEVFFTLWNGFDEFIRTLWDGISTFFTETWEGIKENYEPVVEWFSTLFTNAWNGIRDAWAGAKLYFEKKWRSIKEAFSNTKTWFKDTFTGAWNGIRDAWAGVKLFFENKWRDIKEVFSSVKKWFTDAFQNAWNGISEAWSGATTFFSDTWSNIQEVFSPVTDWFSTAFNNAWTGVTDIWDGAKKWFEDTVGIPVEGVFTTLWTNVKSFGKETWQAIVGTFQSGGTIFTGFVDSVADIFKSLVNQIINGINTVIAVPFSTLNGALNTIRNVSLFGAKPFGGIPTITVPQIPQLAEGGFVEKNTPQLAIIGDNRHQGEVVAPEDKLQEMANKAAGNGTNTEGINRMVTLLEQMLAVVSDGGDMVLNVDGEELARAQAKGQARLKRRYTTAEVAF